MVVSESMLKMFSNQMYLSEVVVKDEIETQEIVNMLPAI